MTGAMMVDFEKIVCEELASYNGKAVVLTGAAVVGNNAFCAGLCFLNTGTYGS